MNTVNYKDFKKELSAINAQLNSVSLFDLERETVTLGINWPAVGTVSIDQAQEFTEEMQLACQLAADFKYNGYTITY